MNTYLTLTPTYPMTWSPVPDSSQTVPKPLRRTGDRAEIGLRGRELRDSSQVEGEGVRTLNVWFLGMDGRDRADNLQGTKFGREGVDCRLAATPTNNDRFIRSSVRKGEREHGMEVIGDFQPIPGREVSHTPSFEQRSFHEFLQELVICDPDDNEPTRNNALSLMRNEMFNRKTEKLEMRQRRVIPGPVHAFTLPRRIHHDQ